MKPYANPARFPVVRAILFVPGAILSGIAVGVLAYFLSHLFYPFFIFPVVVGGAGVLAYYYWQQWMKMWSVPLTLACGLIAGLCLVGAFYAVPYFEVRNDFIQDVQKEYKVDAEAAALGFDVALTELTGSSGWIGFMKWRAQEGDQYTTYLMINAATVRQSSFKLQSTWMWIYWAIETLLFLLPFFILMRFGPSSYTFSQSANDWYNQRSVQLGSVALTDRDQLLALLQAQDLQRVSELIAPEDELVHPVLEIYEQRSQNRKGDVLLTVKQTRRISQKSVKRTIVGRWEIPPQEYAFFTEALKLRLAV